MGQEQHKAPTIHEQRKALTGQEQRKTLTGQEQRKALTGQEQRKALTSQVYTLLFRKVLPYVSDGRKIGQTEHAQRLNGINRTRKKIHFAYDDLAGLGFQVDPGAREPGFDFLVKENNFINWINGISSPRHLVIINAIVEYVMEACADEDRRMLLRYGLLQVIRSEEFLGYADHLIDDAVNGWIARIGQDDETALYKALKDVLYLLKNKARFTALVLAEQVKADTVASPEEEALLAEQAALVAQAELAEQTALTEQDTLEEQASLTERAALTEQTTLVEQLDLAEQTALTEQDTLEGQVELAKQTALTEQDTLEGQTELATFTALTSNLEPVIQPHPHNPAVPASSKAPRRVLGRFPQALAIPVLGRFPHALGIPVLVAMLCLILLLLASRNMDASASRSDPLRFSAWLTDALGITQHRAVPPEILTPKHGSLRPSGSIELTWTPSDWAETYVVAVTDTASWRQIYLQRDIQDPSVTLDASLFHSGGQYRLFVLCARGLEETEPAFVDIRIEDLTPPVITAPTDVAMLPLTDLTVRWEAIPQADSYAVEVKDVATWNTLVPQTVVDGTHYGLDRSLFAAGGQYRIYVFSMRGNITSRPSYVTVTFEREPE